MDEAEKLKKEIEEAEKKLQEKSVASAEIKSTKKNSEVVVQKVENKKVDAPVQIEKNEEVLDTSIEENIESEEEYSDLEDNIDYSKYLSAEQFEDDVSFESIKENVQNKIKDKILKVVFIICLLVLLIIFTKCIISKRKNKGGNLNEKH